MIFGSNVIILILVMAAVIWLQIFLSKKESKWLGLILPFISFLFSLLNIFSIAVLDGMTSWDIFALIMLTFILANISTIVLVGIYIGCRHNIKRKKELEKMNIQDLQ